MKAFVFRRNHVDEDEKMATIRDIAAAAGVNVSTVSRALNGKKSVSEKKRRYIQEIAEKMGYRPNLSAQTLVGKASKTIGVIVPEITSSYFASTINYMEQILNAEDYTLLVGLDHYDCQKAISCLQVFERHNVDGIFLIGAMYQNIDEALDAIQKSSQIPVVFIHSFFIHARYDCVCINDVISSDLIAQHVKDMGHKRVGYIGAELASRNRFSKLKESIQRHGLTLEDHHVKIGNEAYELCGYLQTAKLLQEDNLPTALITSYDYVAIGAMKMLQEKGFCVPQDFALIGYDNIREAEYLSCPLTTIALPVQQMVSAGVEIMLDRIQKGFKREVRHLLFAPDLIVRESSAIHL